jgi:hypothetical protein
MASGRHDGFGGRLRKDAIIVLLLCGIDNRLPHRCSPIVGFPHKDWATRRLCGAVEKSRRGVSQLRARCGLAGSELSP